MESNYKTYDFYKSLGRLDEILDSASTFEDKDEIPKRSDLTYTNGYYVNCSSLFVDLRDSSKMPERHQKRVLAKIYRSYISEIVAIINGSSICKEINIIGDCVSAIFKAQYKHEVDEVFSVAAQIHSLIDVLNYKLTKKGYSTIKAGIGMSFGRVLMIKAGYSGSAINDVVWMGEAVNQASKMCSKASKDISSPIVVTPEFYSNLPEESQELLQSSSSIFTPEYYYGNTISVLMNNWLNDQKKKDEEK
ncbi:adenylate/guanylate cyclase domain-containing protein [Priestia megaterium]|uniref:adenylate/guanylate cyclase domain-containing protein n=1 Tax=Priestia megaterium TaxID=1404 RepID=UPI00249BADCA|nr:adenylate/guanylate cyclase domain-containing protein [Priestia megaterium]MDI3090003.1 adenylate/guanylate cyclase domain-containing protein [Priestia megaterium]